MDIFVWIIGEEVLWKGLRKYFIVILGEGV
jgi:hypothetical protein